MTPTERRAAGRRGTAPSGARRALDAVLPRRTVDPVAAGDPAAVGDRPHRVPRAVPPPLV